MEALSGVASGMAVASLSLQLIESVGKIITFIRDVKGASKELERLANLLDRLDALLQDVRDIMERQTSLQAQQIPTPSMSIFSYLKSCEASIQELVDVVEKYGGHEGSVSALARMKADIHFGFKMKDVLGFEMRIQRDIEGLQAALGVNNTRISLTMLPLIVQNQQAISARFPCSPQQDLSAPSLQKLVEEQVVVPIARVANLGISYRQYRIPSFLECIGIHQQKTLRHIRRNGNRSAGFDYLQRDVVDETCEISIRWRLLGYMRHWSFHYPYGSIVPSLSVYPIVEDLWIYEDLFVKGTIHDIQKSFDSGSMHPFTQNTVDGNFLHLAALYDRPDVCKLLLSYGVKPRLDIFGESCFSFALPYATIDTCRALLSDTSIVGGRYDEIELLHSRPSLDRIEWLWVHVKAVVDWADFRDFRDLLLKELVRYCGSKQTQQYRDGMERLVNGIVDHEAWEQFIEADSSVLEYVFWDNEDDTRTEFQSENAGRFLIELLECISFDVEACLRRQLEFCPDGFLRISPWRMPKKRVIFSGSQNRGWDLRWKWHYDSSEPGFHLVSEFSVLAADVMHCAGWPFPKKLCSDLEYDDPVSRWCAKCSQRNIRFLRRMTSKARKERARTGQKPVRSKMPGSWIR